MTLHCPNALFTAAPPTPPLSPLPPRSAYFNPQSLLNTFIDNQTIELQSVLGIGAYGVVYLGQNFLTGQYFAVKLLIHTSSNSKEIDIHAYLSGHPNILKFEKVVYENNRTFMVIEYCPEGDLFSAITSRSHYNQRKILGNNEYIKYIFLQIIDAVHYCHQNNISHRDLKPENIMLTSKLRVKLADFGLATTEQVSNEFGCGSTFYFSPECQGGFQHRIKGYSTQKNDIWSLGIILINLTAGTNPWKQATLKNPSFASYVRHPRYFFRTVLPNISEELEKILLRIFCLNPAKRISLPELRHYILKCNSFVVAQQQQQIQQQKVLVHHHPYHHHHHHNYNHNHHHYQYNERKIKKTPNVIIKKRSPSMCRTDSITQTMLLYVGGFIDD